jgi:hypothetical protein
MNLPRTHEGRSAFTGPSTTRPLRPFPPTVAIPTATADLARHPPPTATHHEPPKKLVQARTPDQTQRRVPRNALARSARRSQRNGTERGVGRPRFPSTRRPRFPYPPSHGNLLEPSSPFPILHLFHPSALSTSQGQFRTCATSTPGL